MPATVPCPACGQPLARPPESQPVFACPHCRMELRAVGETLQVVVDAKDFRNVEIKHTRPDIFRRL